MELNLTWHLPYWCLSSLQYMRSSYWKSIQPSKTHVNSRKTLHIFTLGYRIAVYIYFRVKMGKTWPIFSWNIEFFRNILRILHVFWLLLLQIARISSNQPSFLVIFANRLGSSLVYTLIRYYTAIRYHRVRERPKILVVSKFSLYIPYYGSSCTHI